MEELLKQSAIDLKNKQPREVAKRLPIIIVEGELAKNCGDYKRAFIFLKRWLSIVGWIKSTKDFKNEGPSSKVFNFEREDEVKALFAEVEKKVLASLAPPQIVPEIEDVSMIETRDKKKNPLSESILNLPETPTDEPLAKESDDFTSCLQLFQILKSDLKFLLIDFRPRNDYNESRIKTDRCINIPADAITDGVLAAKYEHLFHDDKKSRCLYENRGRKMTDIIILLDWSTTSSTLFPGNKMCVLRGILKLWDPGTVAPTIKILDGGYSDWLNRYPTLVTNPKVKAPDMETNAMDEILEEVEYPDWLNADENSSPFAKLKIQSAEKNESRTKRTFDNRRLDDSITSDSRKEEISSKTHNKISTTRNNEITEMTKYSNRIPINNDYTEDMNVEEDELIFESAKYPSNSSAKNPITKPKIDRSSKPSSFVKSTSQAGKQLLTLKAQYSELLRNMEICEKEILWIETELYEQDENDNRVINEEAREKHRAHLKSLHSHVAKLKKEKDQVKEVLTNQLPKSISLSTSEENKECQLDLRIGGLEQRLWNISLERQTLKEKIINKEKDKQNTLKRNENGITKEPLKSDGSSANTGLKRSHSSPNLAQLDNGKIPLVDRSSKPHLPVAQAPSRATISVYPKLTWKDREQRMEPIFRDTRPGITGLKNLGNSCYMNSIIQCLSNNIRLAKYFNEDAYLDDLNKSLNICKQGQVADEVAHVIKALWRGQYKSISPRDLKVVIGQYRLQFDCNEQQDSHEFLVFLLDWLHNDLKKGVEYYLGNHNTARKQWFKSLNNGESIISELFMGQLKSSIICSTCNNSSITYETFNSLTLSLPNTNRCTLDDCVKKFVTGQKVSGWTCDNCKAPREATKKFDFIKLPPTVVIHLNRFADNEGWLQKSNTSVDFPLGDFNLDTYLVDDDNSKDNQIQYDFHRMSLYAVSVHYGTMSGGHYTAYCRNVGQQKWYKYDDQLVSEVSASEVKNQGTSAYLLFYTTIGNESYPYIQRGPMMKLGRF
ncbi:ubiquitin carboxyl-terminal hydrolase 8 isoform X2 [Venturia canescens]|uniref:ubiquitin carboxyl-terminal hydrolase 8 isoform X2 n=1 Tax=Venturia canescens TaxID=32260 RepID=UPI001C9BCA64|nr:ubiquitin carboxyl-terminal hydrolase 8 isoform X2 [Venturia canescens]